MKRLLGLSARGEWDGKKGPAIAGRALKKNIIPSFSFSVRNI